MWGSLKLCFFFFFQAEDGIRDLIVTGVQTCALPISLDQASRLKDQFLANMSHELRTPLNSVIGFSDLLVTMASVDTPLTDTQRDYVETISRNGRHLLELINELLDLSKIAAGRLELRLEPLELEPVLREAGD